MHIRPADQKDLPAIKAILAECELLIEGASYEEWTGWLLVAERQSEVIGFIHVIPAKPYSIVMEFAVSPRFRGSRAAHKLIEAAELLLRTNGLGSWGAFVGDSRNGFHATVEAWGATPTGHGKAYWRKL